MTDAVGDSPLWRFALTLYAAPDVAACCLVLQDAAGCDVNLLLLAAWLAVERRVVLTPADMCELPGRDWHENVVVNLRAARRASKGNADPSFYEKLKQVELEAERIRLGGLFAWVNPRFPERPGVSMPIEANLRVASGLSVGLDDLTHAVRNAVALRR